MDNVRFDFIGPNDVRPLRELVMRPGLPAGESIYRGDEDPGTFHAGAFAGYEIVAIVSFYRDPYPEDSELQAMGFRGMAVKPELQGHGIGTGLLEWALGKIDEAGGTQIVWCNARLRAVPFYERIGFERVGMEFETQFGPHCQMFRRMS